MLSIDKRIGSGELAKFLAMLKLPIEVTDLHFGDFAFLGQGEGGVPVPVGVERKALRDFVTSVWSGRFAGHQLIGLLKCYQVVYVVVEGLWRTNIQTGVMEVLEPATKGPKKGKMIWVPLEIGNQVVLYRDMEQHLFTYEMKGGMMVRYTRNKPETCRFIGALYHWWTDKEWEAHRSHLRFKTLEADKALLVKPTLARQVASTLPGIGWVKSGEVASHFKTVMNMALADEKEWMKVPGVGKLMAQRIVGVLKNGGTV